MRSHRDYWQANEHGERALEVADSFEQALTDQSADELRIDDSLDDVADRDQHCRLQHVAVTGQPSFKALRMTPCGCVVTLATCQ